MDNNRPIGVFDSGIGGLSVLRQLIRYLPHERYVYLGDSARVPYGNKSSETVRRYGRECSEFLMEHDVKLIVVACNTASAVAMEAVEQIAVDIPVIGVIHPAAAAAIRATSNGRIGVIGTRATVSSEAYSKDIFRQVKDDNIHVYSHACPLFMPIVEEGWVDHPATRIIAEDYLKSLKQQDIDTLVLGCTHYPLLSQLLAELMPGVHLIDSGEHASKTALQLLADRNMLCGEKNEYSAKPQIDFFVTDIPSIFNRLAGDFLGFAVNSPKKITLDTV